MSGTECRPGLTRFAPEPSRRDESRAASLGHPVTVPHARTNGRPAKPTCGFTVMV